MKFTLDRQEKYHSISIEEEKIDATMSPELKSEFLGFEDQGVKSIIVDLSKVKYIDSSGLSALLVGYRIFSELGSFVLVGVSDHVKKLINISQLDKILISVPTVAEAIDLVFLNDLEKNLQNEK